MAAKRLTDMLALTAVMRAPLRPLLAAFLVGWPSVVHTRYLNSNSLTGTIPTQVSDLTALREL
jgi:hypothetical protein